MNISNLQRDETTGLWKWPVLLNDDWSKHGGAPCAVLFGRAHRWRALECLSTFDLPARWPHLQMFILGGNLLVMAEGYLQEQALLFAEDVNRQLRDVELPAEYQSSIERGMTWGITFPEKEGWDLSDALAETFALAQRAGDDERFGSINIAEEDWQQNLHNHLLFART